MLSPKEAVDLLELMTLMNDGRPVFMLPVRVVLHGDGTSSKLPKGKWAEAESDPQRVLSLWERKSGGYPGIHLERSGLVLADQDFEEVPDDLAVLLAEHPTFTSLSLRRGLPHRWYRQTSGTARDRKWMWRGTHVGDLKSKGIGVIGTVTDARPFEPMPDSLDTFHGSGAAVADGSLRTLVTAWLNFLDHPPTAEESLAWVSYTVTQLRQAQPGERNNALYRAARDVAQLCAAGALSTSDGVAVIVDAAQEVFTHDEMMGEVRQTVESAFERERRSSAA